MMLTDVLESCMALDEKALAREAALKEGSLSGKAADKKAPADRAESSVSDIAESIVREHIRLGELLQNTDEEAIRDSSLDDETIKQLLSEKQLLGIFSGKSAYDRVNMLTTFSCFMLSVRNGEKKHSRVYMDNVKKIHALVNIVYGKDPERAGGCSEGM